MFCSYCGKHIADDSVYCQHCGRNVSALGITNYGSTESITNRLHSSYTQLKDYLKWGNIVSFIKKVAIYIWKVIHSLFVILGMIIVYTIMGIIMAPFIAMFDVEFPSLGMSDILVDIWKKKKADDMPEEKSQHS